MHLKDVLAYIEGLFHLTPDTKVNIAHQLTAAQAKQDLTHPPEVPPVSTVRRTDIYAVGSDIQDFLNGRDANNPPAMEAAHPNSGIDVETLTKFWLAGEFTDDRAGYEAAFQTYVASHPTSGANTHAPVMGTGALQWAAATDADKYYAIATLKRTAGADVPVEMNRVFGGDVQWNQWAIEHDPTLESYDTSSYPANGPLRGVV